MENDRSLCFFRYTYKATYIGGKFMNGLYFKEFFNKSPNAYSYHRKIVDEQGIPYDYEFLAINQAYEKIMGVKSHDVINKRFYDVFPKGWEVNRNGRKPSMKQSGIKGALILICIMFQYKKGFESQYFL